MVITQSDIASQIGFQVIKNGGNAIDAAVATAFALAVTHPTAGNIGGGGFIVYRPATGEPMSFDFREVGPSRSSPEMWLKDGKYDSDKHHNSHLSVGVPGTVAGLHLAWKEAGIEAVEGAGAAGDQAGARRLRGLARPGALAGGRARQLPEVSGLARAVLEERQAVRSRRDPQAARSRQHADAHRRAGPGRLLRRRDRGADRERDEGQRRPDHDGRPQGVPGEEARRRQGHLSRLRHHRHAAAELRRHGGRRRC